MTSPGRVLAVAALALLSVASLAVAPSVLGGGEQDGKSALELEAALRIGQACLPFQDSLPTLVVQSGLQPGDRTPEVEVCLRNRGSQTGDVSLGVVDRIEREVACSADEADVDATCAPGAAGELGDRLDVVLSRRPRCSGPPTTQANVPFASLSTSPVRLLELRKSTVECVLLRLEYRSASAQMVAAAQTDRVIWRYAFNLSN
jgi:hypothetical protein